MAGNLRWKHLSTGDRFTCGVSLDNKAYCWGRNFEGQLGNPSAPTVQRSPVEVSGGRRFRQIRTGLAHACAITPADVAFCWGSNPSGQLGDGTTTPRTLPTRVAGNLKWRQLSAMIHSCGVTTGDKAYCWGPNQVGQLGDGTQATRLKPTAVSGDLQLTQINSTYGFSCAVSTDRRAWCWGTNGHGQLGDGTTNGSLIPVEVGAPL